MGHVFVSYSHKDTEYAHSFADKLQSTGFDVWIDERLDYGSTWPQEIQKQLDSCDAFIVIMTPRSFDSEWVQNELNRAKRLGKPIFPLLLEGNGPWLSVESTQFADVRDGSFPEENFYEDLEETIPRKTRMVSHPPANRSIPVETTPNASRKSKTPIFAGIGMLVLIVLGTVIFLRNRTSDTVETPISQPATTIPTEVGVETDVPDPVIPTEPPPVADLPSEITDASDVTMMLVPADKYIMGSDNSDSDAGPAHTVSLDAYYIDKYEVTNVSYAECVDAGACAPPKELSSSTRTDYYGNPEFDDYPVLNVDWYMAGNYCSWRGASLPTEAQWEVAARGSNSFIYPWGNSFECRNGNFDDETIADEFVIPGGPNCDGYEDTSPVGSYLSGKSPFGLFDMAGNVWEWVSDSYLENYYSTLGDNVLNPQGPSGGQYQVVRGGSWGSNTDVIQTIYRGKFKPADSFDYLGFRCAMIASP